MRDRWYSDNRDLIKWAVLIHVARTHALGTIIQVPYWRPEKKRQYFTLRDERVQVPDEVWSFFRNVRNIERLGCECGITVKIVAEQFSHTERSTYATHVARYLKDSAHPLLLFLDPDTGLEPQKPNEKHTTKKELQDAWADLHVGDFLVFYQHARREKDWIKSVADQIRSVCGGANVEVARAEDVGRDVAFFCVERHAN